MGLDVKGILESLKKFRTRRRVEDLIPEVYCLVYCASLLSLLVHHLLGGFTDGDRRSRPPRASHTASTWEKAVSECHQSDTVEKTEKTTRGACGSCHASWLVLGAGRGVDAAAHGQGVGCGCR
ncbi:hypothetical protein MRX96_046693 [Rhipicephalus microplus]